MEGLNKEQLAAYQQVIAELEQAKKDAHDAQVAHAAAVAEKDDLLLQIASGNKVAIPVKGSYKGYSFDDGQHRVRDAAGNICESEKVLAAAADKNADGHTEAVAILERLIDLKYAFFNKTEGKAKKG